MRRYKYAQFYRKLCLKYHFVNPDGGEYKLAEERLQLKLQANREPFSLFLKTDAFYDHVDEEAEVELRRLY
jgi:hypothetical protein